MFGWNGKILQINLTNKSTSVIEPSQEIYETYLGGKGLAGYYLRSHITKSWDDFQMPLLFMTGPLDNTMSPTSGRMCIMSKSPLTGTIGDTSVGGKLATFLKRAGWDGLIITGKSDDLSGITIDNDTIQFVDASQMKGQRISQVMKQISSEGSCAVIGPAAENNVLFANIVIDHHYCAGRNGLGCVMASKNLKYLHIKGTGTTEIYSKDEIMEAREDVFRLSAASPVLQGEFGIGNFGTGALYDLMHNRRMMPTNNFHATYFSKAPQMNAYQYKKKFSTKREGCMGCHILCKKRGKNKEVIPEFETMSHFSALIDNDDIDAVVEANRICNETGMDTISAGATIACYQEINGIKLAPKEFLRLLEDIAELKDVGKELAEGSYRYAKKKGKIALSMTVKKQELSAYDPRGAYGMALAFVTSTRGACHLRAYPIAHEILRKPVVTDRFSFGGKARIIKINEDLNSVIDSLPACKFLFFAVSLEEYARLLSGVTGISSNAQDLLKIGERIYYQERMMNALNGFSVQDDDLPERFFTEQGSSGEGVKVPALDRNAFVQAREDYYTVRGLDKNGMPTKEKAEELGLTWNI